MKPRLRQQPELAATGQEGRRPQLVAPVPPAAVTADSETITADSELVTADE